MDEIVNRIFMRLEKVGMDQKTFAHEIGVSPVTITDWKTGKSKSYMKKINIISAALASPLRWLVFGEGPDSKIEERMLDGSLERSKRIADGENVIQLIYEDKDGIKAAFFEGGKDLSPDEIDELWEDAKEYLQFKIEQRRNKQKNEK